MVLSTTFVNFPCIHWSLRQVLTMFCAIVGPSINFCKLNVRLRDFSSTTVNFPYICETFCQLSMHPQVCPSTLVNFSCIRETSSSFINFACVRENFRQLLSTFVLLWDLQSTSVNFLCIHWDYCQFSGRPLDLPSTFHSFVRPYINFR